MASSQQMRPGQEHNECESESEKWIDSVKQAAKMDASDSMQGKKEETSGFLQQTEVQVSKLAQEAAGAMKKAMTRMMKLLQTRTDPFLSNPLTTTLFVNTPLKKIVIILGKL